MSSQAGNVAELEVAAKLVRLGYSVSRPMDDHQRYDIIVDDGVKLYRLQIKRGRRVSFPNRATYVEFTAATRTKAGLHLYTAAEIDGFAVWCPENEGIYWVPIEDAPPVSTIRLLLSNPMRIQKTRPPLLAVKYEICTKNTFQ